LKKILLKDQTWWKDMGIQFPAAVVLVLAKNLFGEDATDSERKRMENYLSEFQEKYGEEKTIDAVEKIIDDESLASDLLRYLEAGKSPDSLLLQGFDTTSSKSQDTNIYK
jgi:arginyl-tRNA synthetase